MIEDFIHFRSDWPATRPRGARRRRLLCLGATLCALAAAAPAGAQSVLERTPNLSGAWVGQEDRLYFNFLHRFTVSDPPARKVANTPTFLLGWGVNGYTFVGLHYATNSDLTPGRPNEWELLGRFSPLSSEVGALFDLGLTAAYNESAESVDGEISLGLPVGRLKFLGVARVFSDAFGEDESRWAFGGGARLSLTDHLALAADVVRPTELRAGEQYGWGAALQIAIPFTPHTLSLQAANTNSATLQGSSRRSAGTRWGFEFTVPITPGRFFGDGPSGAPAPGTRMGEEDLVAGDTLRISITDFEFERTRVVVPPGTYVEWTNAGETLHTVTADDDSFGSPLLAPGESFGRIFTEVGDFPYHCRPHPYMQATVVVE